MKFPACRIILCTLASAAILLLIACDEKSDQNAGSNQAGKPAAEQAVYFSGLQPSLDKSIKTFFSLLQKADTARLLQSVFQQSEYTHALQHYPDLKPAANIKKTANKLSQSNRLHILAWLSFFHSSGFQYLNYKINQKPFVGEGFTIIRGIDIWVTDPEGRQVRFPVFKTVIKFKGGCKIWTILKRP